MARRRIRKRWVVLVFLALLAILFAILWSQRVSIGRGVIADELEARGVPARYEVTGISANWQRLEKVSIGDPANPDLTAEWAEVEIVPRWLGIGVRSIRAHGVRLNARLVDGKVSMGAVDRLLPPPSDEPFAWPDIDVALSDARIRLDTPSGRIGARLDGQGQLTGGFKGQLAAVAPAIAAGGCSGADVSAWLNVAITRRELRLTGPVRSPVLRCGTNMVSDVNAGLDVRVGERFDRWRGETRLQAGRGEATGVDLARLSGLITFSGDASATTGSARLGAESAVATGAALSGLTVDGRYRLATDVATADGRIAVARVIPDRQTLASVASIGRGSAGTPIGPLADRFARAVAALGRGATLSSGFAFAQRGGEGELRLRDFAGVSASGARLSLGPGGTMSARWGGSGLAVDGSLALGGGGLPDARVVLARNPAGGVSGTAVVAPYAQGASRLELTPARFVISADGAVRLQTRATLDGPLADGRVTGLSLPIALTSDARGLRVNPGCAPLAFRGLSAAGLELNPATLRLCPAEGGALLTVSNGSTRGGAVVTGPRLSGRLGSSPIALAASSARYALGSGALGVADLAVRLGEGETPTRLDVAALTGRVARSRLAGEFAGTSGQIGAVPLLLSDAAGTWALTGGVLELEAALKVADTARPPRFEQLDGRDVRLALKDGRVGVTGLLVAPKSNITVARVDIAHALNRGEGRALLDVAGLAFGQRLQPEELTSLTLGVIANVRGSISGQGEIRWTEAGVTSTGDFRTDGMNFAAAFGPVTGLKGDIRFSDLLGLETPPGQKVAIADINPGVPVTDGVVSYQLLPGQVVQVEGGRWPFAGGELLLEPTRLDLSQASTRRLPFRIAGLDAAKFINQLAFENIAATGTFDGTLPMVFDETGGKIDQGLLIARAGGGRLAYIGQVSNEQLGTFGNLAFDALKSLRYNQLRIELDGPLDGELVTLVRFRGVNEAPLGGERTPFLEQLVGVPFIFNVNIRAPFRGLITMARSFTDPSALIRDSLPDEAVQPAESGEKP